MNNIIGDIYPTNNYGNIKILKYVGNSKYKIKFIDTNNISIKSKSSIKKGAIRDNKKINIVGNEYKNKYGKYKVIEFIGYSNTERKYKIEFIETGYKTISKKGNIINDRVKDYYYPSVSNIGYLGDVKKVEREIYLRWKAMLTRVYNNDLYNNIKIDKKWHCFKNFQEDVKKLSGWNKEKLKKGKIELDKDKLQYNIPYNKRIYSKNTCCWLSSKEQSNYLSTQKKFKAISPNGKIYYGRNQTKFAKKHNLDKKGINHVLNGWNKTHFNWEFEFIE